MNFFEHQDQARKKSKWLILAFIAAVIAIIVAMNLMVLGLLVAKGGATVNSMEWVEQQPQLQFSWDLVRNNASVFLWTSLIVGGLIGAASLWKVAILRGGGGVVARSMGGTLVPTDVRDPARRRLRNVVEEVAIASGVPVPEIYVLEREAGINAFAAGYSTGDAAVAVSRGCLENLSRDELQGVVAHEFSHIFNGDMRLNIRLMGILFGILMLGMAGRHLMRVSYYSGGDRRNGLPLLAVGLGVMAIGFIGLFFGRLIQAAVSRQREFLADASAVQFTRNPDGISGALKKIAALSVGSQLESEETEEVAHMLFSSGVSRMMFATHPKLEDRIKAIDPRFSTRELGDIAARIARHPAPLLDAPLGGSGLSAGASLAGGVAMGLAAAGPQRIAAGDEMVEQVGTLSWDHVVYAAELRRQLPESLLDVAHSLQASIDVVLALLIDRREEVAARQLALIDEQLGDRHRARVEQLLPDIAAMSPLLRLPLVELSFPALRRRPAESIQRYLDVIDRLVHADGDVDVFEFSLSRLVSVYLLEAMQPSRESGYDQNLSLREVRNELNLVFGLLAGVGHEGRLEVQRAHSAGMTHLFSMAPDSFDLPTEWVDAATSALHRIDRLVPLDKEIVVEGLIKTLAHDGQITLEEVELLRAVCAAIHCPMPPKLIAA